MVKLLKIEDKIYHCEKCMYCIWMSEDNCGNTGWFCYHPKSDHRLLLVKGDYDNSEGCHVYIPEWCPLPDLPDLEEPPKEIPTTLDECFAAIKKISSEEARKEFKEQPEKDALGKSHFGFGTQLRNKWGLWSGSELKDWFIERGIHHPDDMSGIILTSFWRSLNNKPIELDEQIEHYQAYWRKIDDEPAT